jgi:mxaD protein
MKKALSAGALLAMTFSWQVFAAAPTTLKVTKTADIKAPVDKVWAAVKDFDSLDKWHPGFSKDELIKGTNNTPGAERKLTIKDGPSFTEHLIAFDDATHSYTYKIIESPLPIDHYVSHLVVKKHGSGSKVIWSSTFKRKNTSDTPPEAESDAGAKKLVSGVYDGGLDNLKKMFGG